MKRKMYILLAIVMVSLCVAGCGKNNEKQDRPSAPKDEKVKSVKVSVANRKFLLKPS